MLAIVDDPLPQLRITALHRTRIAAAEADEGNLLNREQEIVFAGWLELKTRLFESFRNFGRRLIALKTVSSIVCSAASRISRNSRCSGVGKVQVFSSIGSP